MGLENAATELTNDERQGLLIKSVNFHTELDEVEQQNIERAVEWTIHTKFRKEQILTERFVKRVHKRMFGDVWKWAGQFRTSEKNIGVPWIQMGIELRNLFEDVFFWIDNETYGGDEIAIRFKHRIVQIHCFPNGNGRHSRLMADIIAESLFGNEPFSWNQSSRLKTEEKRLKYIEALRTADAGDIQPLIEFARS